MEFVISTEPRNLMFSDLEVGETFAIRGVKSIFLKVSTIELPDVEGAEPSAYINLNTGHLKLLVNTPDFPIQEVDFEKPIKARVLV